MSDATPPPDKSLFAGENLACIRGERLVFTRLSFALAPGGALLLRGPNGSGKSSLLRLLAGLTPPEAGELRWGDTPIAEDRGAHRARLHLIGHLDALKPALTAEEMLGFWAGMRGGAHSANKAIALFGLRRLAELPCRLLSAGEKKRLSLARLIASPAELWLLDEPTTALDSTAEAALMRAIAEHRAEGGRVVIATHAAIDIAGAEILAMADFSPKRSRAA